ncbi:hypothetical protein GCM10023067_47710 [Aminobacter aganoensis]
MIHAVSDEQDMRKMGGLRKLIPTTYWMMVIGTLALTGVGIPATIIGTAGFFSKDAIIEGAFVGHNAVAGLAFAALVIAACFTSFYSWRLIFMTFHGKPRATADVMHHVHESPPVMLVPLFILAVGALFAGVVFHDQFIGEGYNEFWKGALFTLETNHILHDFHGVPMWVKLAPFVAMIAGFLMAYLFYIARRRCRRYWRNAIAGSTPSCSTSGTSTSCTTSCSCAQPSGSAASCGRRVTAG